MTRHTWRWVGFAVLIALAASAWIAETAWPVDTPTLLRLGLESVLVSLVAALLGWRGWGGICWREWVESACWGVALLGLPVVISAHAGPVLSSVSASLIFTLVPAVVVLVVANRESQFGADAGPLPRLAAAMAGVAGAALILPFSAPSSASEYGWVAALVAAAVLCGIAIVRLRRLLATAPLSVCVAAVCGGSGLLLLLLAGFHRGWSLPVDHAGWAHEALLFCVLDAPIWVLTVGLIRKLEPAQFASRFLLVPLLTVLEGIVLVRPGFGWTLLAGLVLLAFASWRLLRTDDSAYAPPA